VPRASQNVDHVSAGQSAIIESDDVVMREPHTSARCLAADGGRIIGAVDAILRVTEIWAACARRFARACGEPARKISPPSYHLGRRNPIAPSIPESRCRHPSFSAACPSPPSIAPVTDKHLICKWFRARRSSGCGRAPASRSDASCGSRLRLRSARPWRPMFDPSASRSQIRSRPEFAGLRRPASAPRTACCGADGR
jgi:hypothetical protein